MALQIWIPGTDGTLKNQGLYPLPKPSYNNIISTNNGKLGKDIKNCAIYHLNSDFIVSSWSICTWIKFSSWWNEWNNIIFAKNTSDSVDSQIYLSIINNTTLNIGRGTSDGFTYQLSNGFQAGVWYHIAATCDGTNVTLYLNGSKVAGGSSIGSYKSALNLCIGCRSTNTAGTSYTGWGPEQNDIRVYDHCLSPKEVKEISKGLVLHYPLNDAYLQSTTNLNKSIGTKWVNWGTNTIISDSFISPEGTTGSHIKCSSFTSGGIDTAHSSFSVKPSTTYVISAKMKLTGYTHSNLFYWLEYDSSNTRLSEGGKWSSTRFIEYGHGYKLYYGVVTTSSTTNAVGLQSYFYGVGEHWIYDIQVEEGNYPTPFAGYNTSRNETTVHDCSGYQNNGTASESLPYALNSPRYKGCYYFNATSKRITLPTINMTGFADTFSISWWGNVPSYSNSIMYWGFSNGNRLNYYSGRYCNTNNGFDNPYYVPNTTTTIATPSINEWHHFVMVGDGSTNKLYMDGALYGVAKTYKGITGNTIVINGYDSSVNYKTNGYISDFRIYSTALSADDIKELYNTSCIINS